MGVPLCGPTLEIYSYRTVHPQRTKRQIQRIHHWTCCPLPFTQDFRAPGPCIRYSVCENLRNSTIFHRKNAAKFFGIPCMYFIKKFRPLEVKNHFRGHPIGGGVVALYQLSSQGADSLPPPLSGEKAGSNNWNE